MNNRPAASGERLAPAFRRETQLPADLIFYVNAATSSAITRRTIAATTESCSRHPDGEICGADPFYLAVTSYADWATGIVMPVANLVVPAFGSDGLHLISAANSPWLHTHHSPKKNSTAGCPAESDSPVGGFCFHVINPGVPRADYTVAPIAGKTQKAFWIFNVGHNVMKGHTDVWNPTVSDMVSRVITHNRRFQVLAASAPAVP